MTPGPKIHIRLALYCFVVIGAIAVVNAAIYVLKKEFTGRDQIVILF
jgi:hypothetical protein